MFAQRHLNIHEGIYLAAVDGKESLAAPYASPRHFAPWSGRLKIETGQCRCRFCGFPPSIQRDLCPDGDAPTSASPAHGTDAGAVKAHL